MFVFVCVSVSLKKKNVCVNVGPQTNNMSVHAHVPVSVCRCGHISPCECMYRVREAGGVYVYCIPHVCVLTFLSVSTRGRRSLL